MSRSAAQGEVGKGGLRFASYLIDMAARDQVTRFDGFTLQPNAWTTAGTDRGLNLCPDEMYVPWVIYSNGTRTSVGYSEGGTPCGFIRLPEGAEFEVMVGGKRLFGHQVRIQSNLFQVYALSPN